MGRSLVIVESPAKAKTINKYLGRNYAVRASLGHVKDLPKKVLGIDVDNNFEPTYEVIAGKEKVLKELRALAADADAFIWRLIPIAKAKRFARTWRNSSRRWLRQKAQGEDRRGNGAKAKTEGKSRGETSGTVAKYFAFCSTKSRPRQSPRLLSIPAAMNTNLVDAQQTRRVLDRLVGYKISPLLWDKVRSGLSAGRVQTVALRLIAEREREIRAFMPKRILEYSCDVERR